MAIKSQARAGRRAVGAERLECPHHQRVDRLPCIVLAAVAAHRAVGPAEIQPAAFIKPACGVEAVEDRPALCIWRSHQGSVAGNVNEIKPCRSRIEADVISKISRRAGTRTQNGPVIMARPIGTTKLKPTPADRQHRTDRRRRALTPHATTTLPTRKPGQPSKYRAEFPHFAETLCRLGAIDSYLATAFEVSQQTIDNWKRAHSEFAQAIRRGKLVADIEVAAALYKRACGYSYEAEKVFVDKRGRAHIVRYLKHVPPCTLAIIFWLKNRRPDQWSNRRVTVNHAAGADALGSTNELSVILASDQPSRREQPAPAPQPARQQRQTFAPLPARDTARLATGATLALHASP